MALFDLLDIDCSGSLSVDEFLLGCMRLKGHAKSVDIASIMVENKRMMQWWGGFGKYVVKQFEHLRSLDERYGCNFKSICDTFAVQSQAIKNVETMLVLQNGTEQLHVGAHGSRQMADRSRVASTDGPATMKKPSTFGL
jgi:hypothetical protein